MATVMFLPGFAFLAHMQDGVVVLAFDGSSYMRDHVVPTALGRQPGFLAPSYTAGEYVAHCMTEKFGPDRQSWPPLTLRFLSQEA